MTDWAPFREPLRTTLLRTIGIAAVAGGVFALVRHRPLLWPAATIVMLWPSLGGHWVELWFLNGLRPRLPDARGVQVAARVAVWFVGGIALGTGMWLTASALPRMRLPHVAAWWLAGVAFIAVELLAHLGFRLRGRPSFYDGRG